MTNTCVVRHAKDKGSGHIFVRMCQHQCMLHICTYHNYTNKDGWMGRCRYIADINESLYIVCICVCIESVCTVHLSTRVCTVYIHTTCMHVRMCEHVQSAYGRMHACRYVFTLRMYVWWVEVGGDRQVCVYNIYIL